MSGAADLAERISELVGSLPDTYRAAWMETLAVVETPDEHTVALLVRAHPGAGLGPRATYLVDAWRAVTPTPSGAAVALALAAAAARYGRDLAEHRIDIVVSGPVSDAIATRMTASVVVEVIRAAESALLVTSYAAVGVEEVADEIRAAADRGVRVDLLLETVQLSGGTLAGRRDGREAFRTLRFHPDVHLWQWANDVRHGAGGRRGSMHAKVIAADRAVALLGSANLTDNAHLDNLEIGALIHDRAAVGRLVDHFAALRSGANGPIVRLDWDI